jgi:uncharacterized protein YciI
MHVADPRQVPSTIFMYTLYPTRLEMFTSGPTDAERSSAAEHWIYSQQMLREGVVVFAGRAIEPTSEGAFAIVVIRADSQDDARALMNADPAVRSGIFRARLFPFQPMLMGEWPAEAATANPAQL